MKNAMILYFENSLCFDVIFTHADDSRGLKRLAASVCDSVCLSVCLFVCTIKNTKTAVILYFENSLCFDVILFNNLFSSSFFALFV